MHIKPWLKEQYVLPTTPEFEMWLPLFKGLGISEDLLHHAFLEDRLPNFATLFLNCVQVKNYDPTLDFSASWQLYTLCEENHYLDELISNEETKNEIQPFF